MKNNKQYVIRTKDVTWKTVEKQAILLKLEEGVYYGVNEVGLSIWKLLNDAKDTATIIASISKEFNISEKKATHDVHGFLKKLEKEKLIESKT